MASADGSLRELFALRDYVRNWTSRILGGAANQMLMIAAAWQMYELTGSAWDLGLVGLYQFAPVLLLTLVAGHAADRYHRGRIVAAAMSLQLLAAALLLWATAAGALTRELLFGVSVLLGIARAFSMPASQSITPSLVPTRLLARAMAVSAAGFQAAVIGGPALAGLLFVHGATTVYSVCLVLLAIGIVLVLLVRLDRPTGTGSMSWQTVLAGLHYVWTRKQLLGAVSLDLLAVLFGGAVALLPIFAKDILHVGPEGLGMLRSAPAVGALVISVVLARHPIRSHIGKWLLGAVALYGLCMLAFGLSTHFLLSLFLLALSGCFDMVSVVVRQTLMQLDTPDDMRGRVGAVNSMFIGASNQLGEFESGATAAVMGPVASVVFGGACTVLVVAAWWRLFPALARRQTF